MLKNSLILTLLLILTCSAGCSSRSAGKLPEAKPLNQSFNDFSLSTLNGKQIALSQFRGKYVLLHFFASWCKPCKQEMRELAALDSEINDKNFSILSVAVMDSTLNLMAMLEGEKIRFPIAIDRAGKVFAPFKRSGIPTTFLIDPKGRLHELYDPQLNKLGSQISGPRNWNVQKFRRFVHSLTKRF